MRGKVEDYKAHILSLLFFKRLSDNYEWETEKKIGQFRDQFSKEPNQKQLTRLQDEGHAFVIPPHCFWEDVRDAALGDKNERLGAQKLRVGLQGGLAKAGVPLGRDRFFAFLRRGGRWLAPLPKE